jgi:5'-3' exonuclease
MSKKRLFLIDGNSFCYRAYYAIRPLTNSKGQPTNAIYGFITMINKIIKENSPEMLAVAFDLKGRRSGIRNMKSIRYTENLCRTISSLRYLI